MWLPKKQISAFLDHFRDAKDLTLVVQCSAVIDANHFQKLKHCIDRTNWLNVGKLVCVVIHLTRSHKNVVPVGFIQDCSWDSFIVERIESENNSLKSIAGCSKLSFMQKKVFNLGETIKENLSWAFTGCVFDETNVEGEDLRLQMDHILKDLVTLKEIENRISILLEAEWLENLDQHDSEHWQVKVACNKGAVGECSLKEAWLNTLSDSVRHKLKGIVFLLEKHCSWMNLSTAATETRAIWSDIFHTYANSKVVQEYEEMSSRSVIDVIDLTLRFPFSQVIFYEIAQFLQMYRVELKQEITGEYKVFSDLPKATRLLLVEV